MKGTLKFLKSINKPVFVNHNRLKEIPKSLENAYS